MNQILLRSQIPFGRLDGSVTQQELDLFQLAARCSAQLRAGPSKIMRSDAGKPHPFCVLLQHLPPA